MPDEIGMATRNDQASRWVKTRSKNEVIDESKFSKIFFFERIKIECSA